MVKTHQQEKHSVPSAVRPTAVEPAAEPGALLCSPEEAADLLRNEQVIKNADAADLERAISLEEICETKDFRKRGYDSFEHYVEDQCRKTRQWAYDKIKWLRCVRFLEQRTGKQGTDCFHALTARSAAILNRYLATPETLEWIYDYAADAEKDGGVPKHQSLQDAVGAYTDWTHLAKRWAETYGEAEEVVPLDRAEFQALKSLRGPRYKVKVSEARERAKVSDKSVADCLVDLCRERAGYPSDLDLLEVARGDDLLQLVIRLVPLSRAWEKPEPAAPKPEPVAEPKEKKKRGRPKKKAAEPPTQGNAPVTGAGSPAPAGITVTGGGTGGGSPVTGGGNGAGHKGTGDTEDVSRKVDPEALVPEVPDEGTEDVKGEVVTKKATLQISCEGAEEVLAWLRGGTCVLGPDLMVSGGVGGPTGILTNLTLVSFTE